jgi:signal transduction histidine kinase
VVLARPSEERLLEADTPLDQIMALLGHELRNPLAAISIALDLLDLSVSETQRARHGIDVVKRQTQHLVRLSEGLLDLARVARGKLHLEAELFDLDRLLSELVADRETGILRRGIQVIVELDAAPVFVLGDRTRITQVFDNLLSNATKFTPSGWIKVSSLKEQGTVVVRIEDTGVGIAPEQREAIFRPFVQSRSAMHGLGLGLGLSLAKLLIELHGGSIEVESAGSGKGSCFVVRLPCGS